MTPCDHPEATLVIFTHNRADYLRISLQAALDQTFKDFELLIMDNASTDATEAVVRSFQDPRIRYNKITVMRPLPVSYQLALHKARGRFILLSHDDDCMHPTLVEREVAALKTDPSLVAVTTNVATMDEFGRPTAERKSDFREDITFERGTYFDAWNRHHLWMAFPTLMVRRPLIRRIFSPRPWYAVGCLADIYIMVRLNMAGPVHWIADPLLSYRQHSQQAQFRYDQVHPPLRLHRRILRLSQAPAYRQHSTLAFLLLLKYRLQLAVLRSRDPLGSFRSLSGNIQRVFEQQARTKRQVLKRMRGHGDLDARGVFEASPWSAQISICGFLTGLPDLAYARDASSAQTPFHAWLGRLRSGSTLCAGLPARGIRRIAIQGSMLNGALLAMDAVRSGLEVVVFLDSNQKRCKTRLAQLLIRPTSWLLDHCDKVDAVLVSSENGQGEGALRMLDNLLGPDHPLPRFSWKDL